MAEYNLSFVRYVGDGVTKTYALTIAGEDLGYFRTTDIRAYVDKVLVGTTINPQTPHLVTLASTPASGAKIMIRREVPINKTYADFSRGNNFGQRQVNNSFLQQLYLTQQILDGFLPEGFYFKDDVNLGGNQIINLGDPETDDAALNRGYADSRYHRKGMDIDMQYKRILNLPKPASAGEPVRLADLTDISGGGEEGSGETEVEEVGKVYPIPAGASNLPQYVKVYLDGVLLTYPTDYTIQGQYIVLTNSPNNGQIVRVTSKILDVTEETDTGTQLVYVFPDTWSNDPAFVKVYINGVLMTNGIDYTIEGHMVILRTPPVAGAVIKITSRNAQSEEVEQETTVGVQTYYRLPEGTSDQPNDITVKVNGVTINTPADWIVLGRYVMIKSALQANDTVTITSKYPNGGKDETEETEAGTNRIYPIPAGLSQDPNDVKVYINGTLQRYLTDYTIEFGNVVLKAYPPVGAKVLIVSVTTGADLSGMVPVYKRYIIEAGRYRYRLPDGASRDPEGTRVFMNGIRLTPFEQFTIEGIEVVLNSSLTLVPGQTLMIESYNPNLKSINQNANVTVSTQYPTGVPKEREIWMVVDAQSSGSTFARATDISFDNSVSQFAGNPTNVQQAILALWNTMFPVGSYDLCALDIAPNLRGRPGLWRKIDGGYPLATVGTSSAEGVSRTVAKGTNTGKWSAKLTVDNMPEHDHELSEFKVWGANDGNSAGPLISLRDGPAVTNTTNKAGKGTAFDIGSPLYGMYVWERYQ